ncbi:hypothetical protein GW17_00038040, partial [Ensete ventricosum]
RGAVTPRSRSADYDIDLFLDGSLRAGRRIPSGLTFWRCLLVSYIPTEMFVPNEELGNVRDDGLHHPGQGLNLVSEAKEGLGSNSRWPRIIVEGENPGSLNSL